MNIRKLIRLIAFSLLCFTFFSCASSAELEIASTGDVTVRLAIQPSQNTAVVVKNAVGETDSLFDKAEITKQLKSENIETLDFRTDQLSAVFGSFKIPNERVQSSELFDIDVSAKTVSCNISKENLAPLIESFPQDIKDYLDLFVSPITTGESLTSNAYEELVASVYGPKIANELKTSFFKVVVSCPGVIVSVKTEPEGRVRYFAGNSATLTVPLSYILTLDKPLKISINYK